MRPSPTVQCCGLNVRPTLLLLEAYSSGTIMHLNKVNHNLVKHYSSDTDVQDHVFKEILHILIRYLPHYVCYLACYLYQLQNSAHVETRLILSNII